MQAFWPPEMLAEQGHYSKPLDIWQLGCLFFTCVAHFFPFGDPMKQPNFRKLVESGDYAEESVPETYPHLRELIRSCLTVDAAQRPTAEEVLAHPFFVA